MVPYAGPSVYLILLAIYFNIITVLTTSSKDYLSRSTRYDHARIITVPTSLFQRDPSLFYCHECSVFSHTATLVTALVPDAQLSAIKAAAMSSESVTVSNTNVQALIDEETQRLQQRHPHLASSQPDVVHAMSTQDFFSDFHPYTDVAAYCASLAHTYPDTMQYLPSIGISVEQRDIFALKITGSSSGGFNNAAKKTVYIQALLHAREWIATSTALYFAHWLLSGYKSGHSQNYISQLMDALVFVIIPVYPVYHVASRHAIIDCKSGWVSSDVVG